MGGKIDDPILIQWSLLRFYTAWTLNGLRQLIEYPLCALVSFGALRRDWTMLSAMRAGSRLCIQASDAPTPCCMPA